MISQGSTGNYLMTSGTLDFKLGYVKEVEEEGRTFPYSNPFFRLDRKSLDELTMQMGNDEAIEWITSQSHLIAAICSVISSPKVYREVVNDFAKLNRQRVRKNMPPLLNQRDVKIILPKPEGQARSQSTVKDDGDKRGTVRHFVSTFTRLKRGKIELVSPHWRGDATLGVKVPSYFATGRK